MAKMSTINKYNSKKQNFKPQTKQVISNSIREKARLNKHIIPVTDGDIVEYKAKDMSRPIYKVINATMDSDGIYEVLIQKIDSNGKLDTNKFTVTMDKISRFWLQIGDKIMHKDSRGIEYFSEVEYIFLDRELELTVQSKGLNKDGMYLYYRQDFGQIILQE